MKLQGLSVFFCLIAVPIILVMTYYVQAQVNTIALQMSYDTKLLDATHDSMVALEINTANENLSAVSDSLRSIVKASTNIFINSLATNLGMSNATKSALQPYVPAMLFSLYDGYYIYSPTRVPVICTDEHGVAVYVGDEGVKAGAGTYTYDPTTDDISAINEEDYGMLLYKIKESNTYVTDINNPNVEFKIDYVLKSYTPYAARYKTTNKDIQVNYTLDNFINIYGDINGVYYTRSGYYTNIDVTRCVTSVGDIRNYGDEEIEEFCSNTANEITIDVKVGADTFTITTEGLADDSQAREAIAYYLKTNAFSDWVRSSLSDIEECHIEERISNELYELTIDGKEVFSQSFFGNKDSEKIDSEFFVRFKDNDTTDGVDLNKHGKIFDPAQDPESDTSVFMNHKHNVMKNSMQYNLNLAMSSYNQMSLSSYAFYMPLVDEETWGRITSRISVLTFMQGWNCGLKTYNNYACVSSTNNEFTVIPEEIYYVGVKDPADPASTGSGSGFDNQETQYHRIDCPVFKAMIDAYSTTDNSIECDYKSFVSKEIKYDKIYDRVNEGYVYDHRNLACYTCIVSRNYKTPKPGGAVGETGYYGLNYSTLSNAAKKAYIIALGKEREELYKTNQIINNQGVSIDKPDSASSKKYGPLNDISVHLADSSKKLKDIDSIEITISDVQKYNVDDSLPKESYPYPVTYARISINGNIVPNNEEADGFYRIVTQESKQTIYVRFKDNPALLDNTGEFNTIRIETYTDLGTTGSNELEYYIDTIKINYKS